MKKARHGQRWGSWSDLLRLDSPEKVGRLEAACLLALSNLLTSSDLSARPPARPPAHTYTRACICAFRLDKVRRLDNASIGAASSRPTSNDPSDMGRELSSNPWVLPSPSTPAGNAQPAGVLGVKICIGGSSICL